MGEILVIDANVMKLVLKGNTKEKEFVEQVLKLCDNIAVSNSILKEYKTVVGLHKKVGWYPEVGFQVIWDDFKNYVHDSFGKNIKFVEKSTIEKRKERLGIVDHKLKKKYDKYDYKLIECAIGCCHQKVIVISRDSGLLGSKLSIKGKTILFMTPEDYLQQRCAQ